MEKMARLCARRYKIIESDQSIRKMLTAQLDPTGKNKFIHYELKSRQTHRTYFCTRNSTY